jgi:hypothetical protein
MRHYLEMLIASRHSSVLACFAEDGAGPPEPAAPHRPVAEHVSGDPRDRAGRPPGGHVSTFPAVGRVGAFVVRRGGGVLALEVEGLGKPFPHLAGLDVAERRLEDAPRSGRVPGAQRRPAFLDRLRAHELMVPRRRIDENVRDRAAFQPDRARSGLGDVRNHLSELRGG